MKNELTNEVYRTKRKLKLLQEDGGKQLMMDLMKKFVELHKLNMKLEHIDYSYTINLLEREYSGLLEQYKQPEQQELFKKEKL